MRAISFVALVREDGTYEPIGQVDEDSVAVSFDHDTGERWDHASDLLESTEVSMSFRLPWWQDGAEALCAVFGGVLGVGTRRSRYTVRALRRGRKSHKGKGRR